MMQSGRRIRISMGAVVRGPRIDPAVEHLAVELPGIPVKNRISDRVGLLWASHSDLLYVSVSFEGIERAPRTR